MEMHTDCCTVLSTVCPVTVFSVQDDVYFLRMKRSSVHLHHSITRSMMMDVVGLYSYKIQVGTIQYGVVQHNQ